MPFAIEFTPEADQFLGDDPSVRYAIGRIEAGDLNESFTSSLYEWNRHDYESQWLLALEQLIAGDRKVVLITYYVNPAASSNIEWWALYRGEADTVHVQNHLRFYDQLGSDFSVSEASRFLCERRTKSENGESISEWNVPLGEVKRFVDEWKLRKREAR